MDFDFFSGLVHRRVLDQSLRTGIIEICMVPIKGQHHAQSNRHIKVMGACAGRKEGAHLFES